MSFFKKRYRCDKCDAVVLIDGDQRLLRKSCPATPCGGELTLISGPPPVQADRSPSPTPQTRTQHF